MAAISNSFPTRIEDPQVVMRAGRPSHKPPTWLIKVKQVIGKKTPCFSLFEPFFDEGEAEIVTD